jgi:hypothetical protein
VSAFPPAALSAVVAGASHTAASTTAPSTTSTSTAGATTHSNAAVGSSSPIWYGIAVAGVVAGLV